MSELRIELEDGKYTYIRGADCSQKILRYGDFVLDITGDKFFGALVEEIERLKELLEEAYADADEVLRPYVKRLEDQLAESQAREAKLRRVVEFVAAQASRDPALRYNAVVEALAIPADDTALKKAIRQAKREVLLEAANIISLAVGQPGNDWGEGYTAATEDICKGLRRISEELK